MISPFSNYLITLVARSIYQTVFKPRLYCFHQSLENNTPEPGIQLGQTLVILTSYCTGELSDDCKLNKTMMPPNNTSRKFRMLDCLYHAQLQTWPFLSNSLLDTYTDTHTHTHTDTHKIINPLPKTVCASSRCT